MSYTTFVIEQHTALVNRRRAIAAVAKENSETPEHDSHRQLAKIDKEISVLGQIHNPRISAKSLRSL